MMRTTIPPLLITLVLFFHSVELSSHASSSSGGYGGHPSFSVDGTPLGPDEEDIVHRLKGVVLTKANSEAKVVIPFTNLEGKFLQYRIVQRPPYGEQFEPFVVSPDQWIAAINAYAIKYKNDWIFHSAYIVYEQHVETERRRREEEAQHRQQESRRQLRDFRQRLQEYILERRRRGH